jgi:hypothetical protein
VAAAAFVVVALSALAIGSCGSSSLSAPALRRGATRACRIGSRLTGRIALPSSPNHGTAFLRRGIAALEPELARLRLLNPPSSAAAPYHTALGAFVEKLAELRSTLRALGRGADPISAFRGLQSRLGPIETREDAAWRSLNVTACLDQ